MAVGWHWSAFVLATSLVLFFVQLKCSNANELIVHNNNNNNNHNSDPKVTIGAHNNLKFGDRISPRNKKSGGIGHSAASTKSSIKNNFIISNSTNRRLSKSSRNLDESTNDRVDDDYVNDGIKRSDNLVNSVTQKLDNLNTEFYQIVTGRHNENGDDDDEAAEEEEEEAHEHKNQLKLVKQKSGDASTTQSIAAANAAAEAHRLEMSTEFFVVPSTVSASRSTTIRPGGMIIVSKNLQSPNATVTPPTISPTTHPTGLRKEPWVIPVLVLSCLSMLMMAAFEIFVLCKAWRTSPSRRHLFLGQMLLLGLFACSGLGTVITANPTALSCGTIRFGAGVAFALVFASLLVKCVFLISLNSGVYLPAPYQGLLLLFAVLIQVAVCGQWLITNPPFVENVSVTAGSLAVSSRYHLLLTTGDYVNLNPTVPLCNTPYSDFLLSLVYVIFLIIFVAILAVKSRGIRDNYREATYIGLAIGGSIPIWLGWILCGFAVNDRHRDACLAFGLIATSATVFLVMFMPKGRQLAAMGKEGLYIEDREERFSSLSRAGSGYSPSFFHFKPIKYGMMGGGSPTPNNNNNNNNNTATTIGTTAKHQQAVATLGNGKFQI
jgi:7 transmembrane sweet-taste receptor of 3 GCPR